MHSRSSLSRRGSSQGEADLHFRIEGIDPPMPALEIGGAGYGENPKSAVQYAHRASLSDRNVAPSWARFTTAPVHNHENDTEKHG